jgi:hypothetical protein
MSGALIFAIALLATSAIVAGLYFALYRPLERRAAAQQSFVAASAKEHAAEIDSLRKHFQAQQAALQAQIASERAGAADVAAQAAAPEKAAVEPAPGPAAEPVAAAAKTEPEPAAAKAESRRASARKHSPARRAQRKPAAPAAAPAAATDANAEPAFDRETRRALRENIDDDPIGGLE